MRTMENAIRLLREKAHGLDKAREAIDAATHVEAFLAGGVELHVLAAEYRNAADVLAALEAKANEPAPPPRAKKLKAEAAPAPEPATVTPISEAPKRTRGRPRKSTGAAAIDPASPSPPAAAHAADLFASTSTNGAPAPVAEA